MHVTVLISIVILDTSNQRRVTYIIAVIGQKFWYTKIVHVTESIIDGIKTSALEVSEYQKNSIIKRTESAQGKTTIIPTL